MKNHGGPAFPSQTLSPDDAGHFVERVPVHAGGMSLRDYFAAKAMPLAWEMEKEAPTGRYSERMEPSFAGAATRAYYLADAMLKEREKP